MTSIHPLCIDSIIILKYFSPYHCSYNLERLDFDDIPLIHFVLLLNENDFSIDYNKSLKILNENSNTEEINEDNSLNQSDQIVDLNEIQFNTIIENCLLVHSNEHFLKTTKNKLQHVLNALIAFEMEWKNILYQYRFHRPELFIRTNNSNISEKKTNERQINTPEKNHIKKSQTPSNENNNSRRYSNNSLNKEHAQQNVLEHLLIETQEENGENEIDYLESVRLMFTQEENFEERLATQLNQSQSTQNEIVDSITVENLEIISKQVIQIRNQALYLLKNLHNISEIQRLVFCWLKVLFFANLSESYQVPNINSIFSQISLNVINSIDLKYRNFYFKDSEHSMNSKVENTEIFIKKLEQIRKLEGNEIDEGDVIEGDDIAGDEESEFNNLEQIETRIHNNCNNNTYNFDNGSSIDEINDFPTQNRKRLHSSRFDDKRRKSHYYETQHYNDSNNLHKDKRRRVELESLDDKIIKEKKPDEHQLHLLHQIDLSIEPYIKASHLKNYCSKRKINFKLIDDETDKSILEFYGLPEAYLHS